MLFVLHKLFKKIIIKNQTIIKPQCHSDDVESYGSSKVLVGLFGMEDKKAVTLLTGGMKEGDRFKFTGTYGSSK